MSHNILILLAGTTSPGSSSSSQQQQRQQLQQMNGPLGSNLQPSGVAGASAGAALPGRAGSNSSSSGNLQVCAWMLTMAAFWVVHERVRVSLWVCGCGCGCACVCDL
eukprot:1157503-Pelagomonas_calceolata.AAC.1